MSICLYGKDNRRTAFIIETVSRTLICIINISRRSMSIWQIVVPDTEARLKRSLFYLTSDPVPPGNESGTRTSEGAAPQPG
jgi:hypothetical protein